MLHGTVPFINVTIDTIEELFLVICASVFPFIFCDNADYFLNEKKEKSVTFSKVIYTAMQM